MPGMLLGGRTVNAVVGLAYMALTARGLGKVER
jgi:O-antigen/teichoic acid export membrane protein